MAAPHPFYQSMLQRGIADVQGGRYAEGLRSLRIAAFGTLDDLRAYQTAQVHLAIAHEKLGQSNEARLAATKFVQAERIQPSYEQLALSDTTRASFEKIVSAAVEPQYLAQVPSFRRGGPKSAGAVATRGADLPVPPAQPEKKAEPKVVPPQQQQQPQQPKAQTPSASAAPVVTPPAMQSASAQAAMPANAGSHGVPRSSSESVGAPAPVAAKAPTATPVVNAPSAAPVVANAPAQISAKAAAPAPAVTKAPAPATAVSAPRNSEELRGTPRNPAPPAVHSANAQPVIAAPAPQPAPVKVAQSQPAQVKAQPAPQVKPQPSEVTVRLTDAQRLLNEGKILGARNAYVALSERRDVPRPQILEIARGLNRTGAWQESAMIYQRALPLVRGEELHMFYEAVNRYELGELTLARTLLVKALPSLPQTREIEAYRLKIQGAS